jgi:hypothetical protein
MRANTHKIDLSSERHENRKVAKVPLVLILNGLVRIRFLHLSGF